MCFVRSVSIPHLVDSSGLFLEISNIVKNYLAHWLVDQRVNKQGENIILLSLTIFSLIFINFVIHVTFLFSPDEVICDPYYCDKWYGSTFTDWQTHDSGCMGCLEPARVNECSSSPCLHGNCVDEVNGFSCECEEGWISVHCDQIDYCSRNQGICRWGGIRKIGNQGIWGTVHFRGKSWPDNFVLT